jgi:hypothetical protein
MLASFFARVSAQANGCWIWTGSISNSGYGVFRATSAHRFTYAWFVEPIQPTFHIDHLCRNKRCVNPAHCEAVTRSENMRRAGLALTGRCRRRGHLLAEVGLTTQGSCRQCRRISHARYFDRVGGTYGPLLVAALAEENAHQSVKEA